MKKVYIAGPVSGRKMDEVVREFESVEIELRCVGYEVVNPVRAVELENSNRDYCNKISFLNEVHPLLNDAETRNLTLRFCISLLTACEEMHLLPGWQFSEGARIELKVAELLKIKIVFPEDK